MMTCPRDKISVDTDYLTMDLVTGVLNEILSLTHLVADSSQKEYLEQNHGD